MPQITLGDLNVEVAYKNIKNVYLCVYPPSGFVRISAPIHLDLETLRVFAISKLGWIRKQQIKFEQQQRESLREYINRESHYYLGKRYLLKLSQDYESPDVVRLNGDTMELQMDPTSDFEKREDALNDWYRRSLRELVPPMIQKWQEKLNVTVSEFGIRKMKTKWGSCNQPASRIWLNLELAKKPMQCIEYVVVHELVHLLERKHDEKFTARMDQVLPMWRSYKEELNRTPLSHQNWKYCN